MPARRIRSAVGACSGSAVPPGTPEDRADGPASGRVPLSWVGGFRRRTRSVRARELFAAHAWAECRAELAEADARGELDGPQLALLGEVAFLTGDDEQAAGAYARSYRWFLDRAELPAAARSASWCTMVLALGGEFAARRDGRPGPGGSSTTRSWAGRRRDGSSPRRPTGSWSPGRSPTA